MAATRFAVATFTGVESEVDNGVVANISDGFGGVATMANTEYLTFPSSQADAFVIARITDKTTTSMRVYPSGAFTGTITVLVIPKE
jgi:hypothetical protein